MASTSGWPQSCKYFDALTMDAEHISEIIAQDTTYTSPRNRWYLEYLSVSSGTVARCASSPHDDHFDGIFSPSVRQADLVVVDLRQKRLYLHKSTTSTVSVDAVTWGKLLEGFDVLPSFIELLHSNNGGVLKYVSYAPASNPTTDSSGNGEGPPRKPTAFHVGYKIGDWGNEEAAIYSRVDLTTGKTFILMLGTSGFININKIHTLLSSTAPRATWAHIIFNILSTILTKTEQIRWSIDYATQAHEARTGIASLNQMDFFEPLAAAQLRYNEGLQVTLDFANNLATGSGMARAMLEALVVHVEAFQEVSEGVKAYRFDLETVENLVDACGMKIELAKCQHNQIGRLITRLIAQTDITKVLMAQRDTKLTIDIADSTLRDSQIMRSIARVTMIFLPATFMATFFSMVFFHVGDVGGGGLNVSSDVWLYFVTTVPLTILIASWYFRPGKSGIWSSKYWRKIEKRWKKWRR